jgi:hypothetical protein
MNSANCGTPLHYAARKVYEVATNSNNPILITEGALKAYVVTRLCPYFFAVATGGVSCAHEILVNISRGKKIYLAFDNNSRENPAVARQVAKLVKLRFPDELIVEPNSACLDQK